MDHDHGHNNMLSADPYRGSKHVVAGAQERNDSEKVFSLSLPEIFRSGSGSGDWGWGFSIFHL